MIHPTPAAPTLPTSYADDVYAWAKHNPWEGRANMSHSTRFTEADVITDGGGNILKMPELLKKPCFGRPEVFLRQGDVEKRVKVKIDDVVTEIKSRNHRCGKCAVSGVRSACRKVVVERVTSDAGMGSTFLAWVNDTTARHNTRVYTGESGRFWTKFWQAVAARGPFESVNDAVVAAKRAAADEVQRGKARVLKQTQRKQDQAYGREPSLEDVAAAHFERDRRSEYLKSLAAFKEGPRRIAKLSVAGCEITADAWLARTLLLQAGKRAKPADVATWMIAEGCTHGTSAASLKTRIYEDLKRVDKLESVANGPPIWTAFDPDRVA